MPSAVVVRFDDVPFKSNGVLCEERRTLNVSVFLVFAKTQIRVRLAGGSFDPDTVAAFELDRPEHKLGRGNSSV